MKIKTAAIAAIFLALLSACNNPVVIPAEMAVTLPPNQDFILRATVTETPAPVADTPTPTQTVTPSPSPVPTETLTPTPVPTRKSAYPVAPGTPVIDMGFQPISVEQTALLKPVFSLLTAPSRRHSAISTDGQKLFVSTSGGTFLFNRQAEILARWPAIFTADIACDSCMSANQDGSRLAVITRSAGSWEAQVYDIQGDQAMQELALPVDPVFQGLANEASIAISPDGAFLAFRVGTGSLRVLDLKSKLQVLDFPRQSTTIGFTPDGANFVIHTGGELLFYKVSSWVSPASLLLPGEDTPYAFSPDGHLVAIAMAAMFRVYTIDGIKILSETSVPPASATNRIWQIAFVDNKTLAGYAIRWDTYHTSASIDSGQWDIQARKALHFETTTSSAPDALAALWGSALTLPPAPNILGTNAIEVNGFHFISDGIMLINSSHTVCWIKLFTAEDTCSTDPEHFLFASDSNIFKENTSTGNTSLDDFRSGKPVIQVGPYNVLAINRSGDFALTDTGKGTDLYRKGQKLPQESVKGQLQSFAENAKMIALITAESPTNFIITVIDKTTGDAIYQVKQNFLFKPVEMTANGSIYYTQYNLTDDRTALFLLNPLTHETSQLASLPIPAEPQALALSSTGFFAVGQKDGGVLIMSRDGGQSASFQAATGSIEAMDFSPDGRFLAVVSHDGVRIFAVVPASR